jgi:hypothetical protein
VSISKDASTIVVGAEFVDFNSTLTDSGAAYMFRTINSTTTTTVQWTQMGIFVAADRDTNDYLGMSIAIENNIVVVGAYGDDSGTGSVYVVEDTGFSSSIPPTPTPTTTPTTTTSTPSSSGIDMDPTNSPMPNNSTTQPPTAEESPNSDSKTVFTPGVIVGVAAIVVVGVVVLGVAFLNNRVKIQREGRVQQQQQQAMNTGDDLILPPPSLIADAVVLVMPPPVQEDRDETLEAAAFLDSATVAAVAAPTAATITEKELPRYKDQVRAVKPPGPSTTNLPSLPKRNHQLHDQDDPQQHQQSEEVKEEEKEEGIEDQSPAVQPQQKQILHPDPPAAVNYEQQQHRQLTSYKDQVSL